MPETDKVFAGSIPENYDRYLVPLIFESFARDIAQRVAALSPRSVLETAAGSGGREEAMSGARLKHYGKTEVSRNPPGGRLWR